MTSFVARMALATAVLAPTLSCGGGGRPRDPAGPIGPPPSDFPYPVGRITLPRLPFDIQHVAGFAGLGDFSVFPKDHGGFLLSLDGVPYVPLLAVADGEITLIRVGTRFDGGTEYGLTQQVSTTMEVAFGHVDELAPAIEAAAGSLPLGSHQVKIEVQEGQEIGRNLLQVAVDFWILDYELQLSFISPERYPIPHRYSGAYFGYFDAATVAQLLPLAERQDPPQDGRHDYDIPGRLIGNWFLEAEVPTGQFGDFSAHFAIAYDHIYGDQITIADGYDRRFGGGTNEEVRWVKGSAPAPETVDVATGPVKYEMVLRRQEQTAPTVGTFLIQMTDESHIRVEWFDDMTAGEVTGFTGAARIYVR